MDDLHERIKALRLRQNFTLKDISDRTGLSLSFISQVERGSSSLSVTSLNKIAEALNVPITYFFEQANRSTHYYIQKEDREKYDMRGRAVQYERLAGSFTQRKLEPLYITLPPHFEEQTYTHEGEEWYYVLNGEVTFTIEETTYKVKEGEVMHFPSRIRHTWKNETAQPAQLLCVAIPVIFKA